VSSSPYKKYYSGKREGLQDGINAINYIITSHTPKAINFDI